MADHDQIEEMKQQLGLAEEDKQQLQQELEAQLAKVGNMQREINMLEEQKVGGEGGAPCWEEGERTLGVGVSLQKYNVLQLLARLLP